MLKQEKEQEIKELKNKVFAGAVLSAIIFLGSFPEGLPVLGKHASVATEHLAFNFS